MLRALSIHNVVLIEELDIEFREGLCVLTGETGAGKSILLDALGLALGARSESSLVRKGATHAQVSAEFIPARDHPVFEILKSADIEGEGALILRRSVAADGRSRAFINDQPVSIGLLKQVGHTLIEIHGQFETQGLLDAARHREILDGYVGISNPVQGAWRAWKEAESELQKLRAESDKARADEHYIRAAIEDLDALNAQPGEENLLDEARGRLMSREKILAALRAADEALNAEGDPLRRAMTALARVVDKTGAKGAAAMQALERAAVEAQEALSAIQSLSVDIEENGQDLESIDERLYQLRAQARKHGCAVDELPELRERLAARFNMIESGDAALAAQMKAVESARKDYITAADALSAARKETAARLDRLVQKELAPLKMDKAKFMTGIADLPESEWGEHGRDRVRFLVSTNPGASPGPLNKIASGGEMARFMLALKVVMAAVGAQTLVFDEADSGVGGAVADAVGERLGRLAKSRQILVVTHSPQVAARADHHYVVRKDGAKAIKTTVEYLERNAARREEIARMLAGAEITEEARAAAERLIKVRA